MDPIGMVIWGVGLLAVGTVIAAALGWRTPAVPVAALTGIGCIATRLFSDGDLSRRWTALPAAAICVVVALTLLSWLRTAHR
ncbi:MAG: hypothetical protein QM597_01170 [Aeromicrobium sp.]|uniref:hypothetical protein n=1 Tax=Aeromicrobium sp. TaxID=1871063 RepID=UPI0039E56BB6